MGVDIIKQLKELPIGGRRKRKALRDLIAKSGYRDEYPNGIASIKIVYWPTSRSGWRFWSRMSSVIRRSGGKTFLREHYDAIV